MKQLRKTAVLTALVFVMTVMVSMSVKAEQKNTTEALVWGKSYNGTGDWQDYWLYTMDLAKSGKVTFTFNSDVSGVSGGPHLLVYNANDNSKIWDAWLDEGTNAYSINLLAGQYTVKVYTSCRISFSMIPTFVDSGETVAENYMNKNNQLGTASSYAIGQTVKAQFAENDDTDIYKVEISKAGYLNVRFSNNISSMDMAITCPEADIDYNEYDIPIGSSSYKYFVPKGTCYLTFSKDRYDGNYSFSTNLSGMTVTKVKTAKNLKGGKAKITWVKKNDVDGYQVQVALDKKFKKGKKSKTLTVTKSYYSTQNPTNHTFTKLRKGKNYYARVRTYKLVNGSKYYSDWSAAKKFKVKK